MSDKKEFSDEAVNLLIAKVKKAQTEFSEFSQEQVDEIFAKAAMAADNMRIPLAKLAVEETGMGVVEDKVIKNHYACEYIYNAYKNVKTCGVLERDNTHGITKIAEPIGIIAGVTPTTNPTSTAIFKALIALKTRNGIIFCPHPRAKKATCLAAKVILDAAVAAGAPKDIIAWVDEPSVQATQAIMSHPDINLILATGGPAMVKSAYSSGKPAIGVGPGNVPSVIDETADIKMAVSSVLLSKTFDNGMICASEQSVIVVDKVYDAVKAEFLLRGSYILSAAEKEKVGKIMITEKGLNAAIVGQPAYKIAEMAGVKVPVSAKILIGEAEKIEEAEAFAHEKLSPVLAMYKAKNFEDAVDKAEKLVVFGGNGHSAALHTDPRNEERILEYGHRMTTCRVLVNVPSSHGGIGDLFNFKMSPSLTLGCGSWGKNSVSENVGVKHLINIKTVVEREENMLWFKVPPKIYFKKGSTNFALKEFSDKKKAFIVCGRTTFSLGSTKKVTDVLEEMGIICDVFMDVTPDPDLSMIDKAVARISQFKPDLIIAIGGGSPMDAAKIIWLMYEHPEIKFDDIAMRFMDIRKRIFTLPELGKKAQLVCIPTTSGTGSEVTPFTVITDDKKKIKYPIADYALMPNMAIVDPDFIMTMPKGLAAATGYDAMSHCLESYASIMASPYTDPLALKGIEMIFKYLPRSVNNPNDVEAREQMHYAATIAGMAFANAFLGICHSLAHKLGNKFDIAHGLANAYLICQVIKYNSSEAPIKQAAFAQYKYPFAGERYAQIADHLKLGGKTVDEKVDKLIAALQQLKKDTGIALSIKETGLTEDKFMDGLDALAEEAFDDQCTGTNPRYPLISELKELYVKGFKGEI